METELEYSTHLGILYNQDCLETMSRLPTNSIDMIFADPPYNVGHDYGETYNDNLPEEQYLCWVESWIRLGFSLLKDTGSFFLLINSKSGHKIATILDKHGIHKNAIIWQKMCSPVYGKKNLAKNYRILYFYAKTDKSKFYPDTIRLLHRYRPGDITVPNRSYRSRMLDDVWEDIPEVIGGYLAQPETVLYPGTKKPVLPEQCPEQIVQRAMILTTDENDLVLDPFAGVGTTAVVSEKNNRRWICTETNPKLYSSSVDRIKRTLSQPKLC